MTTPIELAVDADAPGMPLAHYWSKVVGAGRANEGLRADWQEQLRAAVAECGFEFIRFHGLFHDDMFVYREVDGEPRFNFQYLDALFDRLLDIGVRPFIEFGFSPGVLARTTKTAFWWGANGAPPTNLDKWAALVEHTVRHWIHRYGIDEVRAWYFEVWNEPNLKPFFEGTRSEYFALYERTVRVVKAIDKNLRVGGPATSNFVPDTRFDGETEDLSVHTVAGPDELAALDWKPVWITEFLDFCSANQLPVDFVSAHPYPTDWALDEHGQGQKLTRDLEATPKDLRTLAALVRSSAYPDAEIHLTEWSSSSSSRDNTHDSVPAATFIVRTLLTAAGLVDSLAYWTFTDVFEEEGAGDELFHGGFGMVTLPGIVKPAYHAFRFLNALGGELIGQSEGVWATRDSATGLLTVLAAHYPPEEIRSVPASFGGRDGVDALLRTGTTREFKLTFAGLRANSTVEVEVLDPSNGSAVDAWQRLGAPAEPTRQELEVVAHGARATSRRMAAADAHGGAVVEFDLEPWSVVKVRAAS
ncbi:GH39 family glycosyl hydrolase [Kribbella sp. CA-245084]|uniref:GH39 family glycosyl hydrolase n=1 Tax=Kribbella sp. CA-245084 TaxID=3239940 RepID=UPI003D89D89D